MKEIYRLLILALALPSLNAQPSPVAKQPALVLTHVTVIDATGAAAKPDVTVIITGDRIHQIASSQKVQRPKNAQVVNAAGKFLIPGLWDMHVHWYERDYLPLFIANGVTGVRGMAGNPVN